ncbi:hypothetical protein BC834DRAFT_968275 [Gloeopeniophorella convolvens]|nr:hypothetical protein BC834DRAFT_968275 [Gloeopeniophorella convolvens]
MSESPACRNPATSSLLDLPDEVLLSVASHLSPGELLSFALLCHHLSTLVAESATLQYHFLLARHGLYEPFISNETIPERLRALKTWERAWIDLRIGVPLASYNLTDPNVKGATRLQDGFTIFIHRSFEGYSYIDLSRPTSSKPDEAPIVNFRRASERHSLLKAAVYVPESDLMAVVLQSGLFIYQLWG